MTTTIDHRNRKILKGRVVIALHEVLGRKPTPHEIEVYFRALHATFVTALYERQSDKPPRTDWSKHRDGLHQEEVSTA